MNADERGFWGEPQDSICAANSWTLRSLVWGVPVFGMPQYSSLLLFVNDFVFDGLAFGVSAFGGERHGLAVF